jgi:hypothetical protein
MIVYFEQKIKTILILLSLLVFILTSCAPTQDAYFDDFSDKGTHWPQSEDDSGLTNYEKGEYRIRVDKPSMYLWGLAGKEYSNVRIEVQIDTKFAVEGGEAGIICRYQNPNSFYFFVIRPDGYYSAHKMDDGKNQIMYFEKDGAINIGESENIMKIECVEDKLRMYVNEELILEIQEGEYKRGDVGLIAGTNNTSGMDVSFDNLWVQVVLEDE